MTNIDFRPGAQVPLTKSAGQAVTQSLASLAYRDNPPSKLCEANNDWATSRVTPPKLSLFEPNLGEAFCRAVEQRMLAPGRGQLIQSFGMDTQSVVEHCLAASHIRKERDTQLTVIMVLCGVLFLPGVLLWLGVFQLRRWLAGAQDRRSGLIGITLFAIIGIAALVLMIKLPFNTWWGLYLRAMVIVPVIGWFWAKQVCEHAADELLNRWGGTLAGGGAGPAPQAVPKSPEHTEAEALRKALHRISAEQQSNVVFYAGPKGILGMGTRWGSWQLAEDLVPAEPGKEVEPFDCWDVAKAIHDRLQQLGQNTLHTGGFPKPSVRHWVVSPIGENAGGVSRRGTSEADGYQIQGEALERICNQQQFDAGDRHYVGVQFVLWDGQLVLTMMTSVTFLHHTLRVEVTAYALGPVHPLFNNGPGRPMKAVKKTFRFWENKVIALPLVKPSEVVRLAARAPLTWYPPLLEHLGGKLSLPEPFGLRHAWADKPWRHRFMADDALRMVAPVLREVTNATIDELKKHGVDTTKFSGRAMGLSGQVQDVSPRQADVYHA